MGPDEARKIIRGLELLCCEDVLRELVLSSLEKTRLQADLTEASQYLKEAYEEGRLSPEPVVTGTVMALIWKRVVSDLILEINY